MARTFGVYSPSVPLNVTWEESMLLQAADGTAVDLTGYDVRAQFYADLPIRDVTTGIAIVPPILELTTPSWYVVPPPWPVIEGADIPSPATQGLITTALEPEDLWTFSPTNEKVTLFWSIVLVNPSTLYTIPVVQGRVTFLQARTI